MTQPQDTTALETRLLALTSRVNALETRLQNTELLLNQLASGKVVQLSPEVMEYIVNITAAHMQNMFQNDVTVDSLVHRMFVAAANAIVYKAQASKNRAPELAAVKEYIPGALRAQLDEAGNVILEEQVKDAPDAETGWEPATRLLTSEGHIEVFRMLLQRQGVAAGEIRYIIDEVTLEARRDEIARTLAARNVPAPLPEDPDATVEETALVTDPAGEHLGRDDLTEVLDAQQGAAAEDQASAPASVDVELDPADKAPAETTNALMRAFNEATAPAVADAPKQDL